MHMVSFLFVKLALCLCSEQARPILWEEEDQVNLMMHGGAWTTQICLVSTDYFYSLIVQGVSSNSGSVWMANMLLEDFFSDPSEEHDSSYCSSSSWCKLLCKSEVIYCGQDKHLDRRLFIKECTSVLCNLCVVFFDIWFIHRDSVNDVLSC